MSIPRPADSPAFWLYTSATTGRPKAAMHRHGSIPVVCETYGAQVLGITPQDRCLSASKAFFAYGLGASVLFPMSAGAAAVLEPAPANPSILAERSVAYAAVPGYDLRLLDEDGDAVPDGTPGTLYVRGASAATGY
jgi:acyl-coenzyme A synthetase/AMP-(fatty) acid ligase